MYTPNLQHSQIRNCSAKHIQLRKTCVKAAYIGRNDKDDDNLLIAMIIMMMIIITILTTAIMV